jgi:hypothetical protein
MVPDNECSTPTLIVSAACATTVMADEASKAQIAGNDRLIVFPMLILSFS